MPSPYASMAGPSPRVNSKSCTVTDTPYALATDGATLYWSSRYPGAVGSVPIPAGGTPTALAAGGGDSLSVAVDQTNVYWADAEGIHRLPKLGGCPAQIINSEVVQRVAADGVNVYWTNSSGQVMKLAL